MATSGSFNYSLTAAGLIAASYEDLGVVAPGVTVPTPLSTLALTRLNMLGKQLQGNSDMAPGLKIHTRQRITLLLAKGQQTYTVGPASGDSRASTLMGRTTVATAYVSGTSLVVAANTDTTSYPGTTISMTSADFIGVQLDNGTIAYTTMNGTPGGTTVTLAGGLSSGAAVGNYVWWFTARAQRFPLLEAAVLRDANFNDVPLQIYRQVQEYEYGVANKLADGTPTAILVEPMYLNTRIICNSQPTDVTKTIVMTVLYPAEDYDATTDDIAFPQEYLRFLSDELGFMLSRVVGRWTPQMEANRKESAAWARSLNPENSVAYFQSAS